MPNETYQRVDARIRELVPETIGCGDPNCHDGHYPFLSGEEGGGVEWGACDVCIKNGIYSPPERPIDFGAIVIAMGRLGEYEKIYELIKRGLSFKPLSEQPQEVIDFLDSILSE